MYFLVVLFAVRSVILVPTFAQNVTDKRRIIQDGGQIKLNCAADNPGASEVSWLVFGKVLGESSLNFTDAQDKLNNFNISSNRSLIVNNPRLSTMEGLVNVTCRFLVNNGTTNSSHLMVYQVLFYKAAKITNRKSTYDVPQEGSTKTIFGCNATGFPDPDIKWMFRNNSILEAVDAGQPFFVNTTDIKANLSVLSDGRLEVMSSDRRDGFGVNLICFANNSDGNATRTFLVRFLKAPKILTDNFDIKLEEEKTNGVVIPCPTTGYPKPFIKWEFGEVTLNASSGELDGKPVFGDEGTLTSSYRVFENGSLYIKNTRYKEHVPHRNFVCVASSFLGEDRKSHKFSIGEFSTFNFVFVLPNVSQYGQASDIRAKIKSVFDNSLSLRSVNVTDVNMTSGRISLDLTWVNEDLEKDKYIVTQGSRTIVNTAAIASAVIERLKSIDTEVARFLMKAEPGPATDLSVVDTTKDEITINWKHPQFFEVTQYQVQINDGGDWKNTDQVAGDKTRVVIDNLDAGTKYLIRLESKNLMGTGDIPSEAVQGETDADIPVVTIVVAILVALAVIAIVLGFVYYRKKRNDPDDIIVLGEINPYERSIPGVSKSNIYVKDGKTFCANELGGVNADDEKDYFSWREIFREDLIMGDTLGQGEFGLVVKALWMKKKDGTPVPVAVKTIKDTATETDRKELFKELRLMAEINEHPNVVNLIGACSNGGPLWIIVELCENGNLLSYLRKNRKEISDRTGDFISSLESLVRVRIAYDVSKGMHYLEDKKIVHRDLAARNVLLGKNKIAKIADFGLSRDIYEVGLYQKNTGGKLPVKWMAIESLKDAIYTSKSDVWSFGVLFWEIETAGQVPYPGIGGRDILGFLLNGFRLERPSETPFEIYEIMKKCWEPMPKARPHFVDVEKELEKYLEERSDYLPVVMEEETGDAKEAYVIMNYFVDVEDETPQKHMQHDTKA